MQNAINVTRSELFDRGKTHGVEELLSLFRYPSAETLEIARAEEIFEQTLEIIHRHVGEGHNYDLEGNGWSCFLSKIPSGTTAFFFYELAFSSEN